MFLMNKISLSSNDDKIMQSIDLIEKYGYEINKNLVYRKKKLTVAI